MEQGRTSNSEKKIGLNTILEYLSELIDSVYLIDSILFDEVLNGILDDIPGLSIEPEFDTGALSVLFRYPEQKLKEVLDGVSYSNRAWDLLLSSRSNNRVKLHRCIELVDLIIIELMQFELYEINNSLRNIASYIKSIFQYGYSKQLPNNLIDFENDEIPLRSWSEISKFLEFMDYLIDKLEADNFDKADYLNYSLLFKGWKNGDSISLMVDNQYLEYKEGQTKNVIEKLQNQLIKLQEDMHNTFSQELEEVKHFRRSAELVLKDVEKLRADKAQSVYEESFDFQYVQSRKLVVDWDPKGKTKYLNSNLFFWGGAGIFLALATLIYFFWQFHTITSNGQIQVVLARLSVFPLISILIWFCFHQYNRQKIIVEDYAHKKTVALSISTFIDQINNDASKEVRENFYRSVFETLHSSPLERLQKNAGKNESDVIAEIGKEIIVNQNKYLGNSADKK